jgi:hypothetical protein
MSTDPSVLTLDELSRRLRTLSQRPLRNGAELIEWHAAAADLRQRLEAAPAAVVDLVPHFVWHYLADADIRMNDAGYRQDQEQQLESVLTKLAQSGSNPPLAPTPKNGAAQRPR